MLPMEVSSATALVDEDAQLAQLVEMGFDAASAISLQLRRGFHKFSHVRS